MRWLVSCSRFRCQRFTFHGLSCRRLSKRSGLKEAAALIRAFQEQEVVNRAPLSPGILFPFDSVFNFKNQRASSADVIAALEPLNSTERLEKIHAVASTRTWDIVPVVEGLNDVGNLAAVCRTSDALGYGGMHVIDLMADRHRPTSRSGKGSEKWMDVMTWTDTAECLQHLRAQGRRVLVTHLDDNAIPISEVDWTQPTAVVFGNEVNGVSEKVLRMADATCAIPMTGFVQSLNISVAAAIILHEAREARVRALGRHDSLSAEERETLAAVYLLRSTREGVQYMNSLLESRAAKDSDRAGHQLDASSQDRLIPDALDARRLTRL